MRLAEQYVRHACIGTDYNRFTKGWILALEESDGITDPKMFERFKTITIEQVKGNDWESTNYKGYRTCWFTDITSDKQKKQIMEMVNNFLVNCEALVGKFILEDK